MLFKDSAVVLPEHNDTSKSMFSQSLIKFRNWNSEFRNDNICFSWLPFRMLLTLFHHLFTVRDLNKNYLICAVPTTPTTQENCWNGMGNLSLTSANCKCLTIMTCLPIVWSPAEQTQFHLNRWLFTSFIHLERK